MHAHLRIALMGATALWSVSVAAVELGVTLGSAAEYTTNSGLQAEDETAEWILSPTAELAAREDTGRVNLFAQYSLAREYYQTSDNDRNVVTGNAALNWSVIPERLDFVANHSRSLTQINSAESFGPQNQQSYEQTNAGPVLRFKARGEDEVRLQYTYGLRSSEVGADEAITHNSSVSYIYNHSLTNSFVFNVSNNQVQYENPLSPDIEYERAGVTWNRIGPQGNLRLGVGRQRASRSQIDDRTTSNTFDFEYRYDFSPMTSLTLAADRALDDQPSQLNQGLGLGPDGFFLPISTDQVDVFVETNAAIGLNFAPNQRNVVTVNLVANETDYVMAPRDGEAVGINADWERQMRPNLRANLEMGYREAKLADQDDEQTGISASIEFTWTISQSMSMSFKTLFEKMDSDRNLPRRNFDLWSGLVTFTYSPLRLSDN